MDDDDATFVISNITFISMTTKAVQTNKLAAKSAVQCSAGYVWLNLDVWFEESINQKKKTILKI